MKEDDLIIIKELVPILVKEVKVILNKEAMVKVVKETKEVKEVKEAKEVMAKEIQQIINKEDKVVFKVVKVVGELSMEIMGKTKEIDHIKINKEVNIHQIFLNKINFNEVSVEIFNIIKYVNIHKLENAQEFMDLILNKKFIE